MGLGSDMTIEQIRLIQDVCNRLTNLPWEQNKVSALIEQMRRLNRLVWELRKAAEIVED